MMECQAGHSLSIYTYRIEMTVRRFIHHVWRGDGGEGREGGQEGLGEQTFQSNAGSPS